MVMEILPHQKGAKGEEADSNLLLNVPTLHLQNRPPERLKDPFHVQAGIVAGK